MPQQAISPIINYNIMPKVFQITPKRTKRVNGTVLTPEMVVTVTTQMHTSTPFYNGVKKYKKLICAYITSIIKKHVAL